jgi:hypothetical protein
VLGGIALVAAGDGSDGTSLSPDVSGPQLPPGDDGTVAASAAPSHGRSAGVAVAIVSSATFAGYNSPGR